LDSLDTVKHIRRKTKNKISHDSIDHDHFNKKGYTVLSEIIIEIFFSVAPSGLLILKLTQGKSLGFGRGIIKN
jgi:hypothetical protein